MKTYLQKRIEHIKQMKLSPRRERQCIAHLKRHGWSSPDTWSLDHHLANYMLPMLKHLFSCACSYPCGITPKQWKVIQGKILYAIERYAKDDCLELARDISKYSIKSNDEKKRKAWLAACTDINARMTEGMKLFAEYFGDLWD
jgi:hypothetical protein